MTLSDCESFSGLVGGKMNDFPNKLKTEIQKGLPGTEIQWQMASSDRLVRDYPVFPGEDARLQQF